MERKWNLTRNDGMSFFYDIGIWIKIRKYEIELGQLEVLTFLDAWKCNLLSYETFSAFINIRIIIRINIQMKSLVLAQNTFLENNLIVDFSFSVILKRDNFGVAHKMM